MRSLGGLFLPPDLLKLVCSGLFSTPSGSHSLTHSSIVIKKDSQFTSSVPSSSLHTIPASSWRNIPLPLSGATCTITISSSSISTGTSTIAYWSFFSPRRRSIVVTVGVIFSVIVINIPLSCQQSKC